MRAANKLNWAAQATLNKEGDPIDPKAYAAILEWRDKANLAVTSLGLVVTHENIQSRKDEAHLEDTSQADLKVSEEEMPVVVEAEPVVLLTHDVFATPAVRY